MPQFLFRQIWRLARGSAYFKLGECGFGEGDRKGGKAASRRKAVSPSYQLHAEWVSAILATGDGRILSLYVFKDWMP